MNLGTATIHNAGSSAIRVSSGTGDSKEIAPGATGAISVGYRHSSIELTVEDGDPVSPKVVDEGPYKRI